jgi:ribosomal protein S18 acetylase RimI-like enzyme
MSILNNNNNAKVELIHLNIGLENRIDPSDNLFPLPDSDLAQVAHFVIAQHSEGFERFFRHDLPLPIREKLTNLDPEQALYDFELVKSILAEDKPCKDVWGGKGYVFRHIPDQSEFPDVLFHEGSFVVMVENEPVAWAWSQEKNGKAAELALEVLPQYRRRGYGRQLSAAWANHIMQQGLVAFYSHLHDNLPSQALAHSLGVVQYAVSAGYS